LKGTPKGGKAKAATTKGRAQSRLRETIDLDNANESTQGKNAPESSDGEIEVVAVVERGSNAQASGSSSHQASAAAAAPSSSAPSLASPSTHSHHAHTSSEALLRIHHPDDLPTSSYGAEPSHPSPSALAPAPSSQSAVLPTPTRHAQSQPSSLLPTASQSQVEEMTPSKTPSERSSISSPLTSLLGLPSEGDAVPPTQTSASTSSSSATKKNVSSPSASASTSTPTSKNLRQTSSSSSSTAAPARSTPSLKAASSRQSVKEAAKAYEDQLERERRQSSADAKKKAALADAASTASEQPGNDVEINEWSPLLTPGQHSSTEISTVVRSFRSSSPLESIPPPVTASATSAEPLAVVSQPILSQVQFAQVAEEEQEKEDALGKETWAELEEEASKGAERMAENEEPVEKEDEKVEMEVDEPAIAFLPATEQLAADFPHSPLAVAPTLPSAPSPSRSSSASSSSSSDSESDSSSSSSSDSDSDHSDSDSESEPSPRSPEDEEAYLASLLSSAYTAAEAKKAAKLAERANEEVVLQLEQAKKEVYVHLSLLYPNKHSSSTTHGFRSLADTFNFLFYPIR
jgi:hypothetical protein